MASKDDRGPVVKLEVFCAASGLKPDQTAGFKAWAKLQKMPPRPMGDWRATLEQFNNRPVR